MTKLTIALLLVALGLVAVPMAVSLSASAQGNCWHCYVDGYGKRICHDDCSCKGTH